MPNLLKEKLYAGQPAYGVSVMIPSPQVVEMVAHLGFDWVLIDCEHGAIGLEAVEGMVMAAEAGGIVPMVRPPTNAAEAIAQVMDRGALGVQVPHVRSAADARRAVEAVKFPPLGTRSLAVGTRAGRYGYGLSQKEYVSQANRETLVCLQLEDVEALQNAEEILAVEGVDVFFVGPSDLSQALGYPGELDAPPVREAIEALLAKIRARGRIAGSAGGAAAIRRYRELGALYLYTHLTRLLQEGAAAFLRAVLAEG